MLKKMAGLPSRHIESSWTLNLSLTMLSIKFKLKVQVTNKKINLVLVIHVCKMKMIRLFLQYSVSSYPILLFFPISLNFIPLVLNIQYHEKIPIFPPPVCHVAIHNRRV